MSKLVAVAASLGLGINKVKVSPINPVVLKAAVNVNTFGNVVDDNGTPTLIDVAANTSQVITPDTIKDAAIAGFTADASKRTKFQQAAMTASETCGTVNRVVFTKVDGAVVNCPTDIIAFCKANDFKVEDVEVAVQNDVIFSAVGVKSISGLTKHDDALYQIDVANNTATIVNATALAEKAVKGIKSLKSSDAVSFAQQFGLITKLVLTKGATTDADAPVA